MSKSLPKPVCLFYGNQTYSVESAARRVEQQVLGDAPRELTFHRFDAAEMLRPQGGESPENRMDTFRLASESVPLLGGNFVIRVDGLERVKPPSKGAAGVLRQLEEAELFLAVWEGQQVWAAQEDLLPGEPRGVTARLSHWVKGVEGFGGAVVVEPADEGELPEFLLSTGDHRHTVGFKGYLKAKLKGRILFAGENPDGDSPGPAAPVGVARLHQLLLTLVENPPPGCWVVLTSGATREKELSTSLAAAIRKRGVVEKFVTYDDYQPVDWAVKEARDRGLVLKPPQAGLLISLAGNDHGRLARELDKLSLLFPKGAAPTLEELGVALHANSRGSLFLVNEKLGRKRLSGALGVLNQFFEDTPNEHPALIGLMARHFRQLYHVHSLGQLGVTDEDLATHLKLHPFLARKVKAQAANFTPLELERILQALAQLDTAAKLHSRLAPMLFKDLAQGICQGRFQHTPPVYGLGQG